jgi:hypothetical protein
LLCIVLQALYIHWNIITAQQAKTQTRHGLDFHRLLCQAGHSGVLVSLNKNFCRLTNRNKNTPIFGFGGLSPWGPESPPPPPPNHPGCINAGNWPTCPLSNPPASPNLDSLPSRLGSKFYFRGCVDGKRQAPFEYQPSPPARRGLTRQGERGKPCG